MSRRKQQSSIEAAYWWTTHHEGELSLADRKRFADWLQASPENVAEYLELADLWQDLGTFDSGADIQKILAQASDADNIVAMAPSVHTASPITQRSVKMHGWLAAAACTLIVAVGAVILMQPQDDPISTTVGEQRSISLADGSIITLNTRTTIRHVFDESARRVELVDGEALFDVARDETWPFIVSVGESEVRVLGTSFNIYKKSDLEATVTVLEGRVAVRAPGLIKGEQAAVAIGDEQSSGPAEVELTDGQQIHIKPKEPVAPVKKVPLERATEWTTRRITFENTALVDVLAEFNRYNTTRLRVEDPVLAMLQLNGVFAPHSQDDLLEYLRKTEGIRVQRIGDERMISR